MTRIKNPKYLKEILAQAQSHSVKAGVYLKYLGNCSFNTHQNPDTIIEFTEGDVANLAAIEEDPERVKQVIKKINLKHSSDQTIKELLKSLGSACNTLGYVSA